MFNLSAIVFTQLSNVSCCRGTLSGAILLDQISLASFSILTSSGKVSNVVSNTSATSGVVVVSSTASVVLVVFATSEKP